MQLQVKGKATNGLVHVMASPDSDGRILYRLQLYEGSLYNLEMVLWIQRYERPPCISVTNKLCIMHLHATQHPISTSRQLKP